MEFVSRFETTITTSTTKIVLYFFSAFVKLTIIKKIFFTWTCEEIFVPIPFSAA